MVGIICIECSGRPDFISPFFYSDQVSYYQYGGAKDMSKDPHEMGDVIYYLHQKFHNKNHVERDESVSTLYF